MARRLTTFSKLLITLLILALIFFGGRFLLQKTGLGDSILKGEQTEQSSGTSNSQNGSSSATGTQDKKGGGLFGKSDKESSSQADGNAVGSDDTDAIDVHVVTWGGFAPGIYFNEGLKHSEYSRYWKEYGLKVNFVLMDDMVSSWQAWKGDQLDMRANTFDGMLLEYEGMTKDEPVVVLQTDWSRGGDVLIGQRGINSINDLKGKRVVLTPMTPSQTFLMMALDAAGMSLDDITIIESVDNPTAATIFKAGEADAAVVWSPTHFEIMETMPGSQVIQSTNDAAYALAGILYAKKDYVDANQDKVQKFYEGWMKASAELRNEANKEKAAKILGEAFNLPVEATMGMMFDAYHATHGDNKSFFGLRNDGAFSGQALYDNVNRLFTKQGIINEALPSYRSILASSSVSRTSLTGASHDGEKSKKFTAATTEQKKAKAMSTKPVSINFATGVSSLSENAKTIIDLEFASVMKTYANSRIRIEGNTDNVGARDMNMRLSQSRAKSVADYLVSTYKIDPNRIITVGNGPDRPTKGCETNATDACKSANRRTDFMLIAAQ